MECTELPQLSLRDIAGAITPTAQRSAGCHVSGCVAQLMQFIDPARWRDIGAGFTEADRENYQQSGFLWEEILSQSIANARLSPTLTRAHELELEGMYGTPDWFESDDLGLLVSETKATWKSAKLFDLFDKKFTHWQIQIKAYCYMAGTNRARLYVFFVNGGQDHDYFKHRPEVHCYALTFTDRELDENWQALKSAGRKAGML